MNEKYLKDSIFADYSEKISRFVFDEKVASVFDDMIRRSVPGYGTVIAMCKVIAEEFAQPGSNIYDLGCSLGAGTFALGKGISKGGCKIIAVDNSGAMLKRCSQIIKQGNISTEVELVLDDINSINISNASIVVLNFTLQFLETGHRDDLIKNIYDGLLPGGVLVLSEKVCFSDERTQQFYDHMYGGFKRMNQYSPTEISQKRKALDSVLVPDTMDKHKQRLLGAGFKTIHSWFQCMNFVSIIAIKR